MSTAQFAASLKPTAMCELDDRNSLQSHLPSAHLRPITLQSPEGNFVRLRFPIPVTPQQPKLLCSSHLGETCPCPPDAVRRRALRCERLTAVYRCKTRQGRPQRDCYETRSCGGSKRLNKTLLHGGVLLLD